MDLRPGQTIGRLIIERELGRGAFGVVYLARDLLLGRRVALKLFPPRAGGTPLEVREKILGEARILAALRSPHIVTLYRVHETPDGGFLVEMECAGGGSLSDRLGSGGAIGSAEALRVLRGLLTGLRAAHAARILHGDIKPDNVLFSEDDTPKLTDFGMSRLLEGATPTVQLMGRTFGSPLYMAPEVITGSEAGFASDLWSAGVVFWQCLTGSVPFPARTMHELLVQVLTAPLPDLPPSVPEPIARIATRFLARAAADRWPSAAEALEALDHAAPPPVRSRPGNLVAPSTSFVGRARELGEVVSLVREKHTRLLTITGPPGCGKSRLMLEACHLLAEAFEGGAYFVPLETAGGAEEVRRLLAAALGGGEYRFHRPFLMALDTFEHLRPWAPETIGTLLREAPQACVLVASRALLQIAGERAYELAPLPDADARRLLAERGGPDGDSEEAARIAAAMERLPLGLEWAASAGEDAGEVALRAALERSLLSLRDWERAALLVALRDPEGLSLEDADTAIDLSRFPDAPLAWDALQSLRDQSLLYFEGDRFRAFRFIREYALLRLAV